MLNLAPMMAKVGSKQWGIVSSALNVCAHNHNDILFGKML